MIRDYLQEALKLLLPETPDWYSWAKTDSDGNKIPNDQRMQTKYVIVEESHIGKVTRPSDSVIDAKVAELKANDEATQYQLTRAPLYPDIGDQLDDLYKKGAFSDEMAAKIKKVKDDNPKPS